MAIVVTCSSCKAIFRVKESYEGKRGRCPRCQAVIDVSPQREVVEHRSFPLRGSAEAKTQLTIRDILEAFQDDIQPVRRTMAYRVSILFLAIAMLVLPALYVLLVSGIACLLYFHATSNAAAIFRTRHWMPILFLYIGPIVVGGILLFFMVKPLFARKARKHKLRTLKATEEPLLFTLVSRIAQAVGAPEPKRIDIDGQVNASASFGSWLGVLFGGDLVLTLGLPLVAGLTIEQLAGVIAHELGHFTQGMGMRLSYIVRSINAWFARIVYEGDDWDEALARSCEGTDLRIALILYAALFCIWLTRAVLWVLMVVGHALSCFLMRQMEYDADRNEARVAGAKVFAETSRKILLLQLASNHAYGLASLSWYKREKIPDDLSTLILRLSDCIPEKVFRKIEKDLKRSKTGFFDTHPAYGERLASVQRENASGVFHLDGLATQLFRDFAKLSRAVTFKFYQTVIGKGIKRARFVPVGIFLGDKQAEETFKPSEDHYGLAP